MAWRNQGLFDDLVDITSKFPWWVGVILAIVAYFTLHPFAIVGIAAKTGQVMGYLYFRYGVTQ